MVMLNPQKKLEEGEEENFGFILVKFHSFASVSHDLQMWGVTPLQMIAIGEALSALGKSQMLEQRAQNSIQVPTPILKGDIPKGH